MVDVADSKSAAAFSVALKKVVAPQAVFVYNRIEMFNIPPAYPS